MESEPSGSGIATVEVHVDPCDVLPAWRALGSQAAIAPYQTPDWLLPWIDTVGTTLGVVPMLVLARDASGAPLAFLPLGIARRRGGLSVATFLGGRDSNFNMGLFRRGPTWTRAALHDLLHRAAAASPRRVDLYALRNQPHAWDGWPNPLLALDRQPSPSFAYKARLHRDPEAFFRERLSRDSRKKLRQKTSRQRGLGAVDVFRAGSAEEVDAVLTALIEQRRARYEAMGIGTDDLPALRSFLDRAAAPGVAPAVELHAMRCAGRIVATLAGTRRGDRFSGMLTSFDAQPELARCSPGELLLGEVMRRACEEGLATFDLGVGEARYKESYCPEPEPLFDSVVPVSLLGQAAALVESARLRGKRSIKQSRWAWPLVKRLRKLRAFGPGSRRLPDGPSADEG